MKVELVYDKRNVKEIPGANGLILAELAKRIHRVFPKAEVKVKPMQANGINTNANKGDKAILNRLLEEMFDEADQWLVSELWNNEGTVNKGLRHNVSRENRR